MKKNNYIFIALFGFLFSGCMSPDEPKIITDNILQGIKLSVDSIEGSFSPDESGPYLNDSITISFEGDPKTDLSKSKLTASIPNNAICEPAFGGHQDLSKPYVFKVKGYDGVEKTYTVFVKIIPSVFHIRTLYTKKASELNFTDGANRAIALSGNYFIVHSTTGIFNYYNTSNASFAGTLSMQGINWSTLTAPANPKCFYITNDSVGHIFAANLVTASGGAMEMYEWDNVSASPKLLFKYTNDQDGQIGRKFYVKGDISKKAYIYLPVAQKNKFIRFEIINGALTSNTPDVINLINPKYWDYNGLIIPIETNKGTNYFTIGDYTSPEGWPGYNNMYMSGKTNSSLFTADAFQDLGYCSGMDYINFQGIKLLFETDINVWNWMAYYIKVSPLIKDQTISTDISPYVFDHDYGSWTGNDMGGNNNLTSDVKVLMSPDGESAIIAYLITNGAVIVKKLTIN